MTLETTLTVFSQYVDCNSRKSRPPPTLQPPASLDVCSCQQFRIGHTKNYFLMFETLIHLVLFSSFRHTKISLIKFLWGFRFLWHTLKCGLLRPCWSNSEANNYHPCYAESLILYQNVPPGFLIITTPVQPSGPDLRALLFKL